MGNSKKQRHIVIPEELFPKIASGDNQAFEELYYLSYRPMYAFIISLTLNKEDADDLMQDTFIRIRSAAHLYNPQGNPMAWMMKIAKNLFLMRKRSLRGKEKLSLEDFQESLECNFNTIKQSEDRLFLQELFTYITEEEREIIILNVLMGMTFKEIGAYLGKPLGTILSKYHRAMHKLKKASKNRS